MLSPRPIPRPTQPCSRRVWPSAFVGGRYRSNGGVEESAPVPRRAPRGAVLESVQAAWPRAPGDSSSVVLRKLDMLMFSLRMTRARVAARRRPPIFRRPVLRARTAGDYNPTIGRAGSGSSPHRAHEQKSGRGVSLAGGRGAPSPAALLRLNLGRPARPRRPRPSAPEPHRPENGVLHRADPGRPSAGKPLRRRGRADVSFRTWRRHRRALQLVERRARDRAAVKSAGGSIFRDIPSAPHDCLRALMLLTARHELGVELAPAAARRCAADRRSIRREGPRASSAGRQPGLRWRVRPPQTTAAFGAADGSPLRGMDPKHRGTTLETAAGGKTSRRDSPT